MIDMANWPLEVQALAEAMSAVSQDLFGAEWHMGCELPVWQAMTEDSAWRWRANKDLLAALWRVWLKVNGWVVWDETLDRLQWLTDAQWQRRREIEARSC